MDGNKRQTIISELIYSPTSMAIDEGRKKMEGTLHKSWQHYPPI
jgi:hypothetical protein